MKLQITFSTYQHAFQDFWWKSNVLVCVWYSSLFSRMSLVKYYFSIVWSQHDCGDLIELSFWYFFSNIKWNSLLIIWASFLMPKLELILSTFNVVCVVESRLANQITLFFRVSFKCLRIGHWQSPICLQELHLPPIECSFRSWIPNMTQPLCKQFDCFTNELVKICVL